MAWKLDLGSRMLASHREIVAKALVVVVVYYHHNMDAVVPGLLLAVYAEALRPCLYQGRVVLELGEVLR